MNDRIKIKIATVSMIKNEADIVEVFARYNANFAAKMYFIDNGCTDGSIEILMQLKKEGLPIEIFNESTVYYEQFLIENKYIKKVCEEGIFDFVIPLDIDEFIAADEDVIGAINSLKKDKVTRLFWRTYCLKDGKLSKDVFSNNVILRLGEKKPFTKVILPCRLFCENDVLVCMGHHDVEMLRRDDYVVDDANLFVAHFPVRSENQIRLKVYQGIIAQLLSSYATVKAFHWKDMYLKMKEGNFDLINYSRNYALTTDDCEGDISWQEKKFKSAFSENIEVKYGCLARLDTLDNIYMFLECIALKDLLRRDQSNGKRIMVYGTGVRAKEMFSEVDIKPYCVYAYIDSDVKKEFSNFDGKIVISPNKIKYVEYDLIVIASSYVKEIKAVLDDYCVPEEKIMTYTAFLRMLCK